MEPVVSSTKQTSILGFFFLAFGLSGLANAEPIKSAKESVARVIVFMIDGGLNEIGSSLNSHSD